MPDSLAAPGLQAPASRSGNFRIRPNKNDIVLRHPPLQRSGARLEAAGRLVMVSNREPYFRGEDGAWHRTAGGLISALEPVMRAAGGEWLAWNPGASTGETASAEVPSGDAAFTLRRIPVTADEIRGYYDGCANRALWPLCHYAFEACHFDADHWATYCRVNRRFARHAAAAAADGELVWVHDYHLFLLPGLLRQQDVTGPIVFFLHIPFPNAECFAIFPWRRELLESLLGADLIGFHTVGYQRNFLRSVARILGAPVDEQRGEIEWRGRTVRTGAFPIGVDYRAMRGLGDSAAVSREAARIVEAHAGRRLILGVDRLDYSKGILEKLAAIEALLVAHPEHRRNVEFVQITVPSRTDVVDYQQLKRRIDEVVGRINGRFSEGGWAPVHNHYRFLPHEKLAAYYLAADVALVAPRRDGMNLVSKEYVACRADGDGVLVLSEFAGSADELGCGALLVNPFDTGMTAAAVHGGLVMPAAERRRRMRAMRKAVARSDVHGWVEDILRAARPADSTRIGRPVEKTVAAPA